MSSALGQGIPKSNNSSSSSLSSSSSFSSAPRPGGDGSSSPKAAGGNYSTTVGFQMPLHYPRYKKSDYEKMPEWQLERLLNQYGLPVHGDLHHKRKFAMGAFLWPDQF